MLSRIASWTAKHPIWVLGGIGLITLFFGIFAPQIEFLTDMEKMLPKNNPVIKRFQETKETFGSQSVVMVAMAAPEGGTVFNLESLKKLYAITAEFEKLENEKLLEDVMSPANMDIVQGTATALVVGPILPHPPETEEDVAAFKEKALAERTLRGTFVLEDGSAIAMILKVHPKAEADQAKINTLMERVNAIIARYEGPERFYVTGDAPLMYYSNKYMHRDLALLLPVVILVIMGVLIASFRSLQGMILPLVVVLLAVIWTVGLMALCGAKFTMASTILPVLLVAVGSAYGIHVVNDYFERAVQGGGSKKELVAQVVEEMANPVFAAALTTAAGFLTLLSAFLPPIRQFGLFTAAGVMFSFILSLTFIPAVLAVLPVPKVVYRRRQGGASLLEKGGKQLASFLSGKGRWAVLGIAVLLIAVFASQIPKVKVETDETKYFRPDSPVIVGMQFIENHFAGGSLQMSVVIDTGKRDGIKDPDVLKFMDELQAFLESLDAVGDASSIVDLVKETNYTLHGDDEAYYTIPSTKRAIAQLLLMYELGGGEFLRSMVTRTFSKAQVTAMVRSLGTMELRKLLDQVHRYLAEHTPPGVIAYTTGMPDIYLELSEKLVRSQITSLITSMGAVWFIVSLLMGSVIAGIIAVVPLVLAVVGNFGTMALAGANLDMATVMIASMVIGIGVDYAVHVITRYRRERMKGKNHRDALSITYNTAGRAVLYNALTLTAGFMVLLLSSFGALGTMGWLMALTMVTSALGALLIIPTIFGVTQPKFLFRRLSWVATSRGLRPCWQKADPPKKGGKTT
ncbi:efflux RND transporter permease subunit [Candidatus Bipolaricaulota sp. J31]